MRKIILLTLPLFLLTLSSYNAQAQTKIGKKEQKKTDQVFLDEMNISTKLSMNKQFVPAIQFYTKYIDKYNQDGYIPPIGVGSLYHLRGMFYTANNEVDLAIADFTTAIRIEPQKSDYHKGLGDAYYYMGKFDSALQEYDESLRLTPEKYLLSSVYLARGNTYFSKGEYLLSIKEYETIAADPFGYTHHLFIISPLIRLQKFSEAKKHYVQFKEEEDNFFTKNNISLAEVKKFFDNKEIQFMLDYLQAVTESLPNERYDEALDLLNKALKGYNIDLNDKEKNNLFYKSVFTNILAMKGYTLEKLDKLAEAKDVYEQSLVINPNQPDITNALANWDKKKQVLVKTDKTAPVIDLISPEPSRSFDIESDNGAIQITGRAKDESGIVSVRINGKKIEKVEEDGLFISNLTLKAGSNSIIISATDKQGNESSKTFTITGATVVKKDVDIPVIADDTPKYYAILIAEMDYQDASIPDLQNPVKDARELKNILESQYTFNKQNIDTLYNRSRDEIMEKIVQRCNTLTGNDNLVIFYAGHGTAEKDKFGDVDGYWIPVSAKKGQTTSYISASDINTSLKRSNAKHILVIADACFSGAFTRQLPGDASKAIQRQYKVQSRKVMASGNLEPVPDNSRFLFYLKKGLKENAEKYLSAKKLFDSFYEAIINNSDNLPQYAAIKNVGDEGGEFVFIKK